MTTRYWSEPNTVDDPAALYCALLQEDPQTILEIEYNIDCTFRDNNGETVLHLVFDRIDNTPRQIITNLDNFLNLGLNVNMKNSYEQTVMHLAVREQLKEVVEFLLNRGGDLNICDKHGNSIAHYLVETEFKKFEKCVRSSVNERNVLVQESVDFIDWLMSKGLDVECKNKVNQTALQLALTRNLQHVLQIFFKYAKDVNFVDKLNRTILHIFLKNGGYYQNYFRQNQTNKVVIPSSFYGEKYSTNTVQILLDRNISVDKVDNDGNTPLHIAGKMGEWDILETMLEKFTNVNACNKEGETVLHVVIAECIDNCGRFYDNLVDVVRTLISKGVDIHSRNNEGFTLVQLATIQNHLGTLQVLSEHNADFRILTHHGKNLLHLICTDMKAMVSKKTYGKMVDLLVSKGCDVNAKDRNDMTPLHVVSKVGCLVVAKNLIEHGAQVNCREKSHLFTPLHLGVKFGYSDFIEELIKAGANVNDKDISGEMALHLAVRYSTDETVKLLLKFGAYVDTPDKYGHLPLSTAIKFNEPSAVEELLKYGADISDLNTASAAVLLNNNDMYHILLDHWCKLKAVGLPCSNDYMHYNEEECKCSRDGCMKEVRELKTCMIDKRTSLFDLLHMNLNKKCFYVRTNIELKELVNSSTLELQFPKYYGLILASYRDGLARKQLIEPAKRAWYSLTKINLPDICLESIFDHLSNANLRKMVGGNHISKLKRTSVRKVDKPAKKKRTKLRAAQSTK